MSEEKDLYQLVINEYYLEYDGHYTEAKYLDPHYIICPLEEMPDKLKSFCLGNADIRKFKDAEQLRCMHHYKFREEGEKSYDGSRFDPKNERHIQILKDNIENFDNNENSRFEIESLTLLPKVTDEIQEKIDSMHLKLRAEILPEMTKALKIEVLEKTLESVKLTQERMLKEKQDKEYKEYLELKAKFENQSK
jgi:hypothetical protein